MTDRYINGDVSDFILDAIRTGRAYRAGALFTGVANTDTKSLLVENTNTDTAVFILEPTVSSDGQIHITKRGTPTVDTEGDAAEVTNKRTDKDDDGGITVTTAGDGETGALSGGDTYPTVTAGSGSNPSNRAPGTSGETRVSDLILPGESLAIDATNESGGTSDISISGEFITVPTVRL